MGVRGASLVERRRRLRLARSSSFLPLAPSDSSHLRDHGHEAVLAPAQRVQVSGHPWHLGLGLPRARADDLPIWTDGRHGRAGLLLLLCGGARDRPAAGTCASTGLSHRSPLLLEEGARAGRGERCAASAGAAGMASARRPAAAAAQRRRDAAAAREEGEGHETVSLVCDCVIVRASGA